ncbi:hypothetical protein V8C37DRAFT_409459 [Trichoderma ceciliae]
MAFQEALHQAGAAVQSQHLICFAGGSNMLEATTSDTSYGSFAAEADGTYKMHAALLGSRNSPQAIKSCLSSAFQDSLHLINNLQSPQPPLDSSFPGVPSPTGSSPDWFQKRSSLANNDELVFSSSRHGSNPCHSRHSQLGIQTRMMAHYDTPQAYQHTSQEFRHDSQYSDKKHVPFYPEDLFHEPLLLPRSPHLFVANSSSRVPVTRSYISSGQLQAFSFSQPSQPSPRVHSRQSSQDGTPTVIVSRAENMDGMVPDMSMLNSPDGAQKELFRNSVAYVHHDGAMAHTGRASKSYTSSDTASSITTFPSLEDKRKLLRVPSTSTPRSRRLSDASTTPLGSPGPQPLDRSVGAGSSKRRSSSGQALLLPRPLQNTSWATDKSGVNSPGMSLPRKSRGKRTKPLEDGKRQLATKRRNERTVCIGCKMAKVMCVHLLHSIHDLLKFNDVIRVYEGHKVLYELDLHACWVYINSICSPVSHPFQQLINGLKIQRQDSWKTCIRDSTNQLSNKENLCDALLAWDDMAPWVTYALVPKLNNPYSSPDDGTGTVLGPDNVIHKQFIIVAAQLSRIIGRKLELQFYDYLKKALANPSICRKLVLDVGRTIMSLRRRLALWTQHLANIPFPTPSEGEAYLEGDSGGLPSSPAERIKNLCQILYVYFCYMRRRLSPEDQENMRTMRVRYPESEQTVEESFPQYESIDGFEDWLQFKDQPMTEMDLDCEI